MRQSLTFEKAECNTGFIRLFRNISIVFVVFSILTNAQAELEPVMALYRSGDFKKVVSLIEASKKKEEELSYKEHILLITSYKKLKDLDGNIRALREAVEKLPLKGVFKRELARSLEIKSNSYTNNITYDLIRKNLKIESIEILSDLYKKSPTKENFTALIEYYNREEDYTEAVGLLEFYGRTNPKGKIYYTHLCKAQYNSKFYSAAVETCQKFSKYSPKNPDGQWYYAKALEKAGEFQASKERFVRASKRFPASSGIQYEAGKALIKEGKPLEGLEHLEKHLKMELSDEALVLKAETLFGLKKYDEALEVFIAACKQHQEPRKTLINKIKAASKNFAPKTKYRDKYNREMSRCKYVYRPSRKAPKGLLGGSYGFKN